MLICKLELREKNDENFQSVFRVGFLKLKLKENEVRDFYLLGSYPLVGRHVVKHG
jgi:hypothetical protein